MRLGDDLVVRSSAKLAGIIDTCTINNSATA
jgi:hypothetical protein